MLGHLVITLWVLTCAFSLPVAVLSFYTCYWTTYAWHSPDRHKRTGFGGLEPTNDHTFSLIIPVRDEIYEVLSATVGAALRQTHPYVQVVVSVGYDDPETLKIVRRLLDENPGPRLSLSVSPSDVHNKPTQLNAALPDCSGEIIGILDAESVAAPELLRHVDASFTHSGASVVQCGVIMTNFGSSFVALRSSLEYFIHHRSKMHFTAAHGAVLMGGNTIFFTRELLTEVGGWDEHILAEDAELSLRLLARGHRVTVAYDPDLVSREEAPATIRAWIRQRTRWNLGFLQTIAKGVWRQLPTSRERHMALWNLLQPAVLSVTGIALPIAVITLFTHPPLWLAMMTWIPAAPTLLAVALECTLLGIFGREHGFTIRGRDYLRLVISAPFYQVLLSVASLRATLKFIRGDYRWEKTAHEGLHLVPGASLEIPAPAFENAAG